MPEFAHENPQSFWEAADTFERKNGRTYTELQIALPRELASEQRHELARKTARELMGERFAYTLAVHTPLAKDNIEQPHMHLMFSERVVGSNTATSSASMRVPGACWSFRVSVRVAEVLSSPRHIRTEGLLSFMIFLEELTLSDDQILCAIAGNLLRDLVPVYEVDRLISQELLALCEEVGA